jgi:tetratricopeptide (TPR) repeat protein
VVSAVIIFIVLPRQPKPSSAEMSPMGEMPDSLMNIELEKIDQLKKALESDPNNVGHLVQLGNLYFDISRPNEAIEYYEKALAIDSLNPLVLTDAGIMYSQIGKSDTALLYFDRAIAQQPDLAQAYFNKGLILYSVKGDKANAIKAWRQYIALIPDTVKADLFKSQVDSLEREL